MGNNYNIKFNPKEPSSESIAKRMDFDALLARHEAAQAGPPEAPTAKVRPLRMRYLTYITATAAAVAFLLVFFNLLDRPDPAKIESAYFAERPFIQPPIEEAAPAFASFQVEVNQGGVYEYESGSRLVVPAAAFMDDYGQLIAGEVEIKYREYHDFVDFFLSGIPMIYDSAGTRYTLESAGMIEIYAEQDGQRVHMAPGKNISIEMISHIQVPPYLTIPPGYNVYQLDIASRRWIYHAIDQMEVLEEFTDLETDDPLYEPKRALRKALQAADLAYEQNRRQLADQYPLPTEPVRPLSPDSDLPTFDFDLSENVSTTAGQDQIWYVSPRNKDFDPRSLQVEWEDYRLRQISEYEYEITFIRGNTEVSILISPAFTGEAYTQAMENYRSAYAEYENRLAERAEQLADGLTELEAQLLRTKQETRAAYREQVAALLADQPELQQINDVVEQKVRNRFIADGFGIWTCARPVPPLPRQLEVQFVTPAGEPITGLPVYLVDKRRDMVHRYLAQEITPIRFDGGSEHLFWAVDEDGQLAVSDAAAWQDIDARADEVVTFVLRPQAVRLTDEQAVRSVLTDR